jgi:hypothetical protein
MLLASLLLLAAPTVCWFPAFTCVHSIAGILSVLFVIILLWAYQPFSGIAAAFPTSAVVPAFVEVPAVAVVSPTPLFSTFYAHFLLLVSLLLRVLLVLLAYLMLSELGLGISDKKIIPRKTELTEQMVISVGIPVVPRNRNSRNSVPNPSAEEKTSRNSVPNPSAEEKTSRNSVPRNRNRSKLSEFPSKPFSGRENNSEFRSAKQ